MVTSSWGASFLALETRQRAHVGMEAGLCPHLLCSLLSLAVAVVLLCHIELSPHGSSQWCADRRGPPEREKRLLFVPFEISTMADFKLRTSY